MTWRSRARLRRALHLPIAKRATRPSASLDVRGRRVLARDPVEHDIARDAVDALACLLDDLAKPVGPHTEPGDIDCTLAEAREALDRLRARLADPPGGTPRTTSAGTAGVERLAVSANPADRRSGLS